MPYTRDDVVRPIGHTLFKLEATHSQVCELVEEVSKFGACSVCVLPSLLPLPSDLGNMRLTIVYGFPPGVHHSDVEVAETARVVTQGADEVGTIVNLAWTVGNKFEKVKVDIRAVREAMPRAVSKVIIEPAILSDEQIVAMCGAVKAAGVDFVKTLTGLYPSGGASAHTVALMKVAVGETMQVKASNEIRNGKSAVELPNAGATRPGLSTSAKVLDTL